jgi:hypothetical protein
MIKTDVLKNLKQTILDLPVDGKGYHAPFANTEAVRNLFLNNKEEVLDAEVSVVSFVKNEEIVVNGSIARKDLKDNIQFNYSNVPLGFILKGEVTVIKGGKGTKSLGVGDWVGLFETSDWLMTHKTRQIGDWNLVSNTDTEILFFSSEIFNPEDNESEYKGRENFKKYLIELARNDRVPQPITSLPLLDWVASHTTTSRLEDCVIIAHTHLLPNNLPFFRHLSYLVGFGRIYVLEKPYSTVKETYNDLLQSGIEIVPVKIEPGMSYEFSVKKSLDILWSKVIMEQKKTNFKNLLIVDDGGDVWTSIPWQDLGGVKIGGVEQTQRGITRISNTAHKIPPVVSVAGSGIKKLVESGFIARSVVDKLKELGYISQKHRVGIIGMGNIGQAVEYYLRELGVESIFYDSNQHKDFLHSERRVTSLDMLVNKSDLVIGTTGHDALKGIAFERISGEKVFASASSADVEFASLLALSDPADSSKSQFQTIPVKVHTDFTAHILNGGYPINFDRKGNATPSEDIVLTRSLMYIGAMQAVKLISDDQLEAGIYNLDPVSQKQLLEEWLKQRNQIAFLNKSLTVDAIIDHDSLVKGKDMKSVWQ